MFPLLLCLLGAPPTGPSALLPLTTINVIGNLALAACTAVLGIAAYVRDKQYRDAQAAAAAADLQRGEEARRFQELWDENRNLRLGQIEEITRLRETVHQGQQEAGRWREEAIKSQLELAQLRIDVAGMQSRLDKYAMEGSQLAAANQRVLDLQFELDHVRGRLDEAMKLLAVARNGRNGALEQLRECQEQLNTSTAAEQTGSKGPSPGIPERKTA